jgi:hypothetical protein
MVNIWIWDGKNSDPGKTSRIRNTAYHTFILDYIYQFLLTGSIWRPSVGWQRLDLVDRTSIALSSNQGRGRLSRAFSLVAWQKLYVNDTSGWMNCHSGDGRLIMEAMEKIHVKPNYFENCFTFICQNLFFGECSVPTCVGVHFLPNRIHPNPLQNK